MRIPFHSACFVLALMMTAVCFPCCEAICADFQRRGDSYVVDAGEYRAIVRAGRFEYYARTSDQPDLVYTPESVRLGSQKITLGSVSASAASDNVVCLYYGEVLSESYTAKRAGIEQCWVIHRRPSSSGKIVIEGRLFSPHRSTSSPSGLTFCDGLGRRIFHYGSVYVIDSAGSTYKCLPHLIGNKLLITLPANYVARARFPILIDPVVGPEVPICPSFGPAPSNQENVDITAGPDGYFAVWQDSRGQDIDIFGSRISPTGEIIDKKAIVISKAAGAQTDPAVAWNGRQYLVVWMDRREQLPHIYCARVQPDGEVLDKQGILLSGTNGSQAYPDVASDGSSWLVVWQQQLTSSFDIYGIKVNSDGTTSRIYGLATGQGDEDYPSVAWNGSVYLLVWRDNRNQSTTGTDIYGCRVGKNGIGLPGTVIISCDLAGTSGAAGNQLAPQVCAFGSTFMVAWQDYREGASRIYASRVSATPAVLDKGGIRIPDSTNGQEYPNIAYNGSKILITWRETDYLRVRGCRLNTSGSVLDPNGRSISQGAANQSGTAACGSGGAFIVGWATLNPGISDVLVTPVSDGGIASNPAGIVASLALDDQRDYAVAYNGSEYVVVWSQVQSGGSHILGARISHSGELLTPNPISLTLAYSGTQSQPAISWNGSHYLLVWTADSGTGLDIKGCRLRTDLSPIDSTPITICAAVENQAAPHVASCGDNSLVVWEDSRNATSPYYYTDIYGALVSSTGSVQQLSAAISLGAANQRKPKVASSGSGYLVVWEDYRAGYPQVYCTRVTTAGQVQDTAGIAMPATSYCQTGPDVCFGGGNYFVVWSDWYAITGCRVSTAGNRLDASGIPISGGVVKYCPSVCWDGSSYRVVWEDYRSSFQGNSDIYYTTVSREGIVSPDPETALVSDLDPQLKPRIVVSGNSGILLYSRYVNFSNGTCGAVLLDQQVQEVATVGAAKHLPLGTLVALRGKVVTGAFSGFFYMQEPDRSSGIKVVSTVPVNVGDIVDAVGVVSVSDGERQISAGILSAMGVAGEQPKPLGIRGDALGGGRLNGYTPGITGGIGANNIGLLVTTWGKVTTSGSDYFYIESKPGCSIKVKSGALLKPTAGKLVAITGISTCDVLSGSIGRAIIPRTQSDIRILN